MDEICRKPDVLKMRIVSDKEKKDVDGPIKSSHDGGCGERFGLIASASSLRGPEGRGNLV
jgi:hypothetical protein